jgi:3D (Asp-Asp-Asp) domain-containing protein
MSEIIKQTTEFWQTRLQKYFKPVFLLLMVFIFSFPQAGISEAKEEINQTGLIPQETISAYYDGPTLPEIPLRQPRQVMYLMVTAYNSEPGQTDDTPFITAFNTRVRDGIIATNFLPKGTIVRFPDLFGDKEFVVEDRMNQRYYYHMDIWMAKKTEAINFGAKFAKMEIL